MSQPGAAVGLRAAFEVAVGTASGMGPVAVGTDEDRPRFELSVDLEVDDGEVLAVVGPNGAGKSTLLRCLAGLQAISSGAISFRGTPLDDPTSGVFVEPAHRSVGLLFQDYLLFPHLSALDNVAFGLRARKTSRTGSRTEASRWLTRMGVAELARSRPGELSGGQAQRVALARALATGPDVLLLDEPLAALDATTHASVQRDLRDHLAAFDGTTILVSHDPLDAFVLADRVAVLEDGEVTQIGSIDAVTSRPRTRYVADLVGVNLLHGVGSGHVVRIRASSEIDSEVILSVGGPVEGPTQVLIRPRSVALHRDRPDTSARNVWPVTVTGMDLLGEHVRLRLSGPFALTAEVTPAAVADLGLWEGAQVWASVKATQVDAYPE